MSEHDKDCGCGCGQTQEPEPIVEPCCGPAPCSCGSNAGDGQAEEAEATCCGGRTTPSSTHDRPGYRIEPFVREFLETPAGPVPRAARRLSWRDRLGTLHARAGLRNGYAVAPGIYALGRPGPDAPVLATGNYKLTFDAVRRAMAGRDAWLVVADTHGINVWCAGGKGTFNAEAIAREISAHGLDKLVAHRTVVVPQLGANGVCARDLKRLCGFSAVFGPIRAVDLPAYLDAGMRADEAMRRVSFTLAERAVLVPVELYLAAKPLCLLMAVAFLVSGIGPDIFSLAEGWRRSCGVFVAVLAGGFGGAVLAPLLLPWLPGRSFYLKGFTASAAPLALVLPWLLADLSGWETMAVALFGLAVGSFLAMNFTGSTPFTSPSGVEREMRRGIPIQAGLAALSVVIWITSAFLAQGGAA